MPSYLTPYTGIVEGSYTTDSALQAITSAIAGAMYWSDESGTYYYAPTKQISEDGDLVPVTLTGMFVPAEAQLVQVSDDGVINPRNVQVSSADLQLSEGSILVGNSDGVATELQAGFGDYLLVGDGTTLNSVESSGDVYIDYTGNSSIQENVITLNMLSDDLFMAYVPRFGGREQWTGGGSAYAFSVPGVTTDMEVLATIHTPATETSTLKWAYVSSADTVTIGLTAANTSNDAIISYMVFKPTS